MNGYFITGTDTGVGKTRITAALLRGFLDKGRRALAVKPVQTGCREEAGQLVAEDVEEYARLAGDHFPDGYPEVCLRKYVPACSPHLAAELGGDTLDPDTLAEGVRSLGQGHDIVLVEGAGGVAVPLSDTATMLDLMQRLDLRVIIVADNKLGMINHTLMTIDTVRNHGLTVAGVVINNTTSPGDDAHLRRDNVETVRCHGGVAILAEVPWLGDEDDGILIECMATAVDGLRPEERPDASDDLSFDRKHLWHPYTSALKPLSTTKVRSARGTRIILDDGTELIDGMASWWCAVHGYNHPELNRAARAQLGRMAHVMFGGLTHEPAISLARKLVDMAPEGLEHVFLADSGSVSVEVAVKMALQYMQADGQTGRTKLFTVRGGYHGDTCGAMSVCDPDGGMHHLFSGLLPEQIFAPRPACRFGETYSPDSLAAAAEIIEKRHGEIAAIIVEPIVQGAGGMWFYHPEYLRGLRELADRYGILLILDEIATGFGRTGRMFACEWSGITPDIMCVGKALSGGYMTLAATMATSKVARTISQDGGVLMHGPTFMGNPLACAVARTSLDLLDNMDWNNTIRSIQGWLTTALAPCGELEGVRDVRTLGAIGVVEMETPVNVPRLQEFFIERGVWLRPFGKLIYTMPPYIIPPEEITTIGNVVYEAIKTGNHRQG